MITNKNIVVMFAMFVVSMPFHEFGHVIALWLLGVSSTIEFAMTSLGPALVTKCIYYPKGWIDFSFILFFGPFFAGVVFMGVGRVRPEAYFAGVGQLIYAPFEVMTWMLYGNEGILNIYILFFLMAGIPALLMFGKCWDKVELYNG